MSWSLWWLKGKEVKWRKVSENKIKCKVQNVEVQLSVHVFVWHLYSFSLYTFAESSFRHHWTQEHLPQYSAGCALQAKVLCHLPLLPGTTFGTTFGTLSSCFCVLIYSHSLVPSFIDSDISFKIAQYNIKHLIFDNNFKLLISFVEILFDYDHWFGFSFLLSSLKVHCSLNVVVLQQYQNLFVTYISWHNICYHVLFHFSFTFL